MATFSPSPAPRHSSRLQTRGNSPLKRSQILRQPTPLHFSNDAASNASAMDIDERGSAMSEQSSRVAGDFIFSKTQEMSVSFYANLPLEVKQVLRTSDFNKDLYSGEIDTLTGFALVTSFQTCFVWQHAQARKGVPTCYIFSCPQDYRSPRPPLHALVPQGTSREPGLILISPAGQIQFWDSISMGLAGGDNFIASRIEEMDEDEEVTDLVSADALTFILSTSFGRLYRLALSSTSGKPHLHLRAFARLGGSNSFSRLFPTFLHFGATGSYEIKDRTKHIHAVALGLQSSTGDRDVWVLANEHIQHWNMKTEGWEEFVMDYNLIALLSDEISKTFKLIDCRDIELSDLSVFNDGVIVILVSYSGQEDMDDFHRLYAFVELERSEAGFVVKAVKSVPYQTTSQPGLPVHPRIHPVLDGAMVSVQFGDAVALCARDSDYQDRLELKSNNNRTLGFGVILSTNALLILTATTMMKIKLDLDVIQAFHAETGRANLIKSTMMQAILYGSSPLNPLRFSFPPKLNAEALMQGAEQLSMSVLRSDQDVVNNSHDLTLQMTGRKERLSWLIGFINENSVLVKMSQGSRQQLATDAEKLYACSQLWLSYNQHLSTTASRSVLKDAVINYMEEIGDGPHEDVMRAFFRYHVADIAKLLKKVLDVVHASTATSSTFPAILSEANRVVLIVLRSALEYRAYNLDVYGIDLPMRKPWTSRPSVIDAVLSLFDLSTEVLETSLGSSIRATDREPGSQLPTLAAILFESIKERLDELLNAGMDVQHDTEELQQRFNILRPEMLETLRRYGYEESAYGLAERYQDFDTLVALCHRDTVYPPSENPHAARIQSYVQRFKDNFTTALFQWYIQHGEIRIMFDQESQRASYMDSFFKENSNDGLSWIHDLGQGRFGPAASSLLKVAESATNLEGKHLILSIGKLAYFAQTQDSNVQLDETTLDAFHDELDFVSVHDSLLEEFRSVLISSRSRQSLESQIEAIVRSKGIDVAERTAFLHIFKDLLRQLLQGKALSIEDTVDLLTLKDNAESLEDYTTSFQLLNYAKNLPEARKESAITTVWRRIYLHDDWAAILKTTDISDEALTERYRRTALYFTLFSEAPSISPSEALVLPSKEEIMSRWPGLSTEQVESLVMDYIFEQDRLEGFQLDDVYVRIKELVESDGGNIIIDSDL